LAYLLCKSLFRSEGIEHALKTVFEGGPSNLFGPTSSIEPEANRVAVIATGDEEEQPVLMSNYNREVFENDEGRECCDPTSNSSKSEADRYKGIIFVGRRSLRWNSKFGKREQSQDCSSNITDLSL
jgi:hypothetical protein